MMIAILADCMLHTKIYTINEIIHLFHRTNNKIMPMKKTIGRLKVGDIITYVCTSVSPQGIPVGHKILRKRNDVAWEDLCNV